MSDPTKTTRRPFRLRGFAVLLFLTPFVLVNVFVKEKHALTAYFPSLTVMPQQQLIAAESADDVEEDRVEKHSVPSQQASSALEFVVDKAAKLPKYDELITPDKQQPLSEKRISSDANNGVELSQNSTSTQQQQPIAAAATTLVTPPVGQPNAMTPLNETTTIDDKVGLVMADTSSLEDYSSVDYVACCGLGHRLARMSCAYHVAKNLKFELRSHWGFCPGPERVEIYSSLFDPPSKTELSYVNSTKLRAFYGNEVGGFVSQDRRGGTCPQEDKIATDVEFYTSLRSRFKRRDDVNAFVQEHLAGKLVLGIHVRAGNGETGDFERKKRQIADAEAWVQNVTNNLRNLIANNANEQTVLFMATDTPSYIDRFRSALTGVMPVVVWEQDRVAEGEGVFFGENGAHKKASDHNECLRRWEDTLIDQILLSHADVVIAGKESSFSQTLPLAIAFGRTERKIATPYCEVRGTHGEQLECFDTYQQWVCHDNNFTVKPKKMPMFLAPGVETFPKPVIQPRPDNTQQCHPSVSRDRPKNFCIPHDYDATK